MADHSKDHLMIEGIISNRYGMLNLDHFVELHVWINLWYYQYKKS